MFVPLLRVASEELEVSYESAPYSVVYTSDMIAGVDKYSVQYAYPHGRNAAKR